MDQTEAEIARLAPDLQPYLRAIVQAVRAAGWPVEIRRLGGRRSAADQASLFAQGRTARGPIVTSTLKSQHISGRAFDLDLIGYDRAAGMPLWRVLGEWWKASGRRWGGDWGDFGHFEW
jgi:peptidoglycan L-alanyl-D-glutamate endopeptidase CwlK